MLKRSIGTILGALALAFVFSGAAHAQATKKSTAAAKAPAKQEISGNGTVASVDATHLMLTRKVNGKDQPITLVLTPETKKTGDIATGSKVAFRYHMENSDMVATSVRATGTANAKTKTPGAPKAKKS